MIPSTRSGHCAVGRPSHERSSVGAQRGATRVLTEAAPRRIDFAARLMSLASLNQAWWRRAPSASCGRAVRRTGSRARRGVAVPDCRQRNTPSPRSSTSNTASPPLRAKWKQMIGACHRDGHWAAHDMTERGPIPVLFTPGALGASCTPRSAGRGSPWLRPRRPAGCADPRRPPRCPARGESRRRATTRVPVAPGR